MYLHYRSCQPSHLKCNIIFGRFLRLRRNSSNLTDYERQDHILMNNFIDRGYPVDIAQEAFETARRLVRKKLFKKEKKGGKKESDSSRITFALDFTPRASAIKNIILKNWHLIKHIPGCELPSRIGY